MGTLSCVTDFGQRKILCLKGLCYDFSSFFFLSLYRRTLQGNVSVLCFVNFPVANKFMDKTGGEYQKFSSEKFLSHSAEKFV